MLMHFRFEKRLQGIEEEMASIKQIVETDLHQILTLLQEKV